MMKAAIESPTTTKKEMKRMEGGGRVPVERLAGFNVGWRKKEADFQREERYSKQGRMKSWD